MAAPVPASELEATNLILAATIANDLLREVSGAVQKRGWYFNTEYHTLQPSDNGLIQLPPNVISVRAVGSSGGLKLSIRDGKVYNMTPFQHGFNWDNPIQVELVLSLDFNEIPPAARLYIAYRAGRIMLAREDGDQVALQLAQADEEKALAELHAEQLTTEPLSMRDSPDVAEASQGGYYFIGGY